MNSIPVFLVVLFTGFFVFAQTPEGEAKILKKGKQEIRQEVVEEGGENSGEAPPEVQEEPPNPSDLRRRRSRFDRGSNRKTGKLKEVETKSSDENPATTPVKEIEVQSSDKKKKERKKMIFAEAQPEDITDENFPDLIKSFDYPNANIMDVANAIGKLTKKNFIIESGVSGKITIVAPTPVTVAQAWKLFLTALAMNDLTVVPTNDGYMKIRKSDKAINDSIETYSGDYYPTSDQLITRIVRLKYIQASTLGKSLEKFIPKGSKKVGKVQTYDDTNSVIISGYGSSVQRISTIIEQLDKPGFEERLEVIPIRHAKAKSIADLITNIIKGGKDEKKGSRFRRSSLKKGGGKNENLKLVTPDERTNSIIVVGNSQGILRIKKLVGQLDYPLDPADAGGVYVYYVKHGEATAIAETLKGVAKESATAPKKDNKKGKSFQAPKAKKPIFGGDVVIEADENTNSLIITANKQDYRVVKSLLAKIDIPKDQVFVEAIIMEMETNSSNVWNMNYMQFFKGEQEGEAESDQMGGVARVGFTGGKIVDLINPVGGKGAILNLGDPKETIRINGPGGQQIEIPTLLALISFLKEKTNANILSTPNILAMDNEESTIEVGEDVPVGGTQNFSNQGISSITPQFKPATIFLKIKPQISPESNIVRLGVEQRIQKVSTKPIQAEQLAQSTQSLTKKELKTNIVLESGQTAVLGGLMEDEDSIQEAKIPLLGDIPILGWFFKNRTVRKIKKNLVVFLTPQIIRNSAGHRRLLQEKIDERIDWIKKYNGGRDPYGERFNSLIENSVSTISPGNGKEFDLEEVVPPEDEAGGKLEPTPLGDEPLGIPDNQESDGTPDLTPVEDQLETEDQPIESLDSTSGSSLEDSSIFWNVAPSQESPEDSSEQPKNPQAWDPSQDL